MYVCIMCVIDQKEVISALCGEMPSVENIIALRYVSLTRKVRCIAKIILLLSSWCQTLENLTHLYIFTHCE